jgi:nitrogen fixation protein FixH
MSDFRPVEGEFTGRHMLYIMIAFFGVIIAVNLVLVWVAARSWTGLVVENSYVASQNFNEELAAAREQEKLGWKSGLTATIDAAHVRITGGEDRPVTGLSVELKLSRPASLADDQSLSLSETTPGEYSAQAKLGPGVWNAELIALGPSGERFRMMHRIFVKEPRR